MKEFHCGDIIAGCGASFRAASADELAAIVGLHARLGHGLTEDTLPAGFTEHFYGHIHDVAA